MTNRLTLYFDDYDRADAAEAEMLGDTQADIDGFKLLKHAEEALSWLEISPDFDGHFGQLSEELEKVRSNMAMLVKEGVRQSRGDPSAQERNIALSQLQAREQELLERRHDVHRPPTDADAHLRSYYRRFVEAYSVDVSEGIRIQE